jgi:hypothetical protein
LIFCFNPEAKLWQKTAGKLNLYIDKKSKKLLGAEMIGPRVEHIAHLLSWSIGFGAKLDELLEMPFYHPTVEEAIRNALNDARKRSWRKENKNTSFLQKEPGKRKEVRIITNYVKFKNQTYI